MVQIVADKNLLQQFHPCRRQKICIKVAGSNDHDHLQKNRYHFRDRNDIGLNIIFLLRIDQTVFI